MATVAASPARSRAVVAWLHAGGVRHLHMFDMVLKHAIGWHRYLPWSRGWTIEWTINRLAYI